MARAPIAIRGRLGAVRGAPGSLVGTGATLLPGRRRWQTPCAPSPRFRGAPWPELKGPRRSMSSPPLSPDRQPTKTGRRHAPGGSARGAGRAAAVGRWLAHHRGVLAHRLRLYRHGRSGLLGGLRDRSGAARPRWELVAAAADHGRRDRHHRRRDRQLQRTGGPLSAGRRSGGGLGHGVRRGLRLSAARRPRGRLRPHHRHQRRRRHLGDHRLLPGGARHQGAARARPAGASRRAHLVRPLGQDPVRPYDAVVRRHRHRPSRLGIRQASGGPRRGDRPHLRLRPLLGDAGVPGGHGPRDRRRGAVFGDRPARTARRRRPAVLRQGHAVAHPARGRRPHPGHHRACGAARHRHPAGQQHADRRRRPGRRRSHTLRAVPGGQRRAPAGRGELLVSGGTGPSESAGACRPPGRLAHRDPAGVDGPHQPSPHPLLGGTRLPAGVGGRHRRGRRSRPGAGPLLCRRRVHELPGRPARHAASSRTPSTADGRSP